MRIISYEEVRSLVTLESAIQPVRESFLSYSRGKANIARVQHLEMPECGKSALHIKSGYVSPLRFCLVKIASTFKDNGQLKPPRPSINGVICIFSSENGEPIALIEDRAWITQIRTAAAGAVAMEAFASADARVLGVIGSGVQARLQAAAALFARPSISTLLVWGRTPANVKKYTDELLLEYPGLSVVALQDAESVARRADILVTATYSETPLILGEWLSPSVLVVAMGADSAHKRELDSAAFKLADLVIVDSTSQNKELAEIGYGISSGELSVDDVDEELGQALSSKRPRNGMQHGRRVICKLTGVAVQEIFVCDSLLSRLGVLDQR